MGSMMSGIFGGGQQQPSIEVSEPAPAPGYSETVEPASRAVRQTEERRLRSRRAFSGTLLTDGSGGAKKSLL